MAQPLTPDISSLRKVFEEKVLPSLNHPPPYNTVVHRLSRSKKVYLLVERNSRAEAVAKVFEGDRAIEVRDTELANMYRVVELGFCEGTMRAVCPYESMDSPVSILMERAKGRDLDHYLKWAVRGGREEKLREKLSLLARWLCELHGRSAERDVPVSGRRGYKYLNRVAHRLQQGGLLSEEDLSWFMHTAHARMEKIGNDYRVFVHGDATPTNLFFRGSVVTAIDFERSKATHRCWDLGFVGGELMHHFRWRGGSYRGTVFLRHFLCEYSGFSGISQERLVEDLPLYLSMGLLRIARNPWLQLEHRLWLVEVAKESLSSQSMFWASVVKGKRDLS